MSENATSSFPYNCTKHTSVAGPFACSQCGNHFCIECCYSMPDGSIRCHDCYAQATAPATAVPTPATTYRVTAVASAPAHEEIVLPGQGCMQHPDVRGFFPCQFCGALSCPTCDFFFPPAMHVCPQCASSSSGRKTPIRKKNMIGALVAGAIATGLFAAAFGVIGGAGRGAEVVVGVIFIFALLGACIGAGLAMASYKKGRSNSIGIWLGLIWNILLILIVVGLTCVGLFMRNA